MLKKRTLRQLVGPTKGKPVRNDESAPLNPRPAMARGPLPFDPLQREYRILIRVRQLPLLLTTEHLSQVRANSFRFVRQRRGALRPASFPRRPNRELRRDSKNNRAT